MVEMRIATIDHLGKMINAYYGGGPKPTPADFDFDELGITEKQAEVLIDKVMLSIETNSSRREGMVHLINTKLSVLFGV